MDDHNELLFARLEEQVLDVAEEDIWSGLTDLATRPVWSEADTIRVDL
jgi:hypothetical protein